jgi:quercetin dioxygenase-like cupin family protein
MPLIDLNAAAAQLPIWQSAVLAEVAGAKLKVLRMDGSAAPAEAHSYPETLLVIEGQLNLSLDGETISVQAGQLFVVPAGIAHAVAPGSSGTLVIMDS